MSVHSQVVEIIFHDNFNARNIVLELAKQHPTIFLKLCGVKPEIALDKEVQRLYANGGGYVSAIKFYREKTGIGLKEAKDKVDVIVGRETPVFNNGY